MFSKLFHSSNPRINQSSLLSPSSTTMKVNFRVCSNSTQVWKWIKWPLLILVAIFAIKGVSILMYLSWSMRSDEETSISVHLDHATQLTVHDNKIPRIIHHIWIGKKGAPPPERFQTCAKTWENLTGYQYNLWNEASLTKFMRTNYPWYLSRWEGYEYIMNKVDTVKYFLMHHFGGIMIDMDICTKYKNPVEFIEFRYLIGGKSVLLVDSGPTVNAEVMVAPPKHPFFMHCIRGLYHSDRSYMFGYLYMMSVGGPLFITGRYRKYPQVWRDKEIYLMDYDKSRKELFNAVLGGTWYTWDSYFIIKVVFFGDHIPHWIQFLFVACIICGAAYYIWFVRRKSVNAPVSVTESHAKA